MGNKTYTMKDKEVYPFDDKEMYFYTDNNNQIIQANVYDATSAAKYIIIGVCFLILCIGDFIYCIRLIATIMSLAISWVSLLTLS